MRLLPSIFIVLAACLSTAAAPSISSFSPHGLRIGATTTITIDGQGLSEDSLLVLPVPVVGQSVKPGGTATRIQIDIEVADSAVAGIVPVRLVNASGITGPVIVGLDRLPQQPFQSEIGSLPVLLHGTLTGDRILRTEFVGRRGDRVVLDVEGRRLSSQIRPVVRLLDERGVQLGWSNPLVGIAGDTRCEVILPSDGKFIVQLHDVTYGGPEPGFFLLKIGDLNYADFALPLAVQDGHRAKLTLVRTSLREEPSVFVEASNDDLGFTWPGSQELFTGAHPSISISRHVEIMETDQDLQEIQDIPVGISGRIGSVGDEDRFLVATTPGTRLKFDVLARRLGSKLDGVLTISTEAGQTLATSDDQKTTADPVTNIRVPDGADKLIVGIKDFLGQGGSAYVYRIVIRRQDRPDYQLSYTADRILVPLGGSEVISLDLARSNYQGPVQLSFPGLPEALRVDGSRVSAGRNKRLLRFATAGDRPGYGVIKIVGNSPDNHISLRRVMLLPETTASSHQPRLRQNLGIAVSHASPISVAWDPTANDQWLTAGTTWSAGISLSRSDEVSGKVRVQLLTDQVTPIRKLSDPEKTQNEILKSDTERTIRLDGTFELAPETLSATVNILVPPDLPRRTWQMALRAELLSEDGQQVLATDSTALLNLEVVSPLSIELTSSPAIVAQAGLGDTGKLVGKLYRAGGFAHPAIVTLAGLPDGYDVPQVDVPAGTSDFTLSVRFAYGTKAGYLRNLTLLATSQPIPERPDILAKSNEIPFTVRIRPGDPPPDEP